MSNSTTKLYDELLPIDNKLAGIRKDSKWGIIRISDGIVLLEIEYDKLKIVSKNLLYVVKNSNTETASVDKIYYGYAISRLFPTHYQYCKNYKKAVVPHRHGGQVYYFEQDTYIKDSPLRLLVFGGYDEYRKKLNRWIMEDLSGKIAGNEANHIEPKPEESDYIPESTYLVKDNELIFQEEIKFRSFNKQGFAFVTVGDKVAVFNTKGEHSCLYPKIVEMAEGFLTSNEDLHGFLTPDFIDPCGTIFNDFKFVKGKYGQPSYIEGYVYLTRPYIDEGFRCRDCIIYTIYMNGKFEKSERTTITVL